MAFEILEKMRILSKVQFWKCFIQLQNETNNGTVFEKKAGAKIENFHFQQSVKPKVWNWGKIFILVFRKLLKNFKGFKEN